MKKLGKTEVMTRVFNMESILIRLVDCNCLLTKMATFKSLVLNSPTELEKEKLIRKEMISLKTKFKELSIEIINGVSEYRNEYDFNKILDCMIIMSEIYKEIDSICIRKSILDYYEIKTRMEETMKEIYPILKDIYKGLS